MIPLVTKSLVILIFVAKEKSTFFALVSNGQVPCMSRE
jgi:hypothetical protein